jgi:hypothetical protein
MISRKGRCFGELSRFSLRRERIGEMSKSDRLAYGLMFTAVPIAYLLAGPWGLAVALVCAIVGAPLLYSAHSRGLEEPAESETLSLPHQSIFPKPEGSKSINKSSELTQPMGQLASLTNVWIIDRGGGEERKAAVEAQKLRDTDPLVYVDTNYKRVNLTWMTPFTLHNRGKAVAHGIQINPLELGVGKVKFKEVDTIDAGDSAEVLPEIELAGPIFKHNIINFLHHEANRVDQGSVKEFPVPMSVKYRDVVGERQFETSFILAYSPYNKMMIDSHPSLGELRTICEVKRTKIRLVSG